MVILTLNDIFLIFINNKMTCIHNTKLYDNLKCKCAKKDICEKHPTCNPELIKKYPNYSSPYRTPTNIKTDPGNALRSNEKILSIHYKCDISGHYFDDGCKIEFDIENDCDKSYIVVVDEATCSKEKYILKQFHFHVASENTLNDVFYPMEMHLVHENFNCETGISKIVIISLLVDIGKRDMPFLEGAFDKCNFNKCTKIDLSCLNKLTENVFYSFLGSLSSPPFTVYVKWFVFSSDEVCNLRLTISDCNYRKHLELYENNRLPLNKEFENNRYAKPLQNNFLAITKIKPCY
jgi:carbonic anhydrase